MTVIAGERQVPGSGCHSEQVSGTEPMSFTYFRGLLTPHANWSAMIPRPVVVRSGRTSTIKSYISDEYLH